MVDDLLSGMESIHLAIVLVIYIVVRELFVYLRSKKEGQDPVTRVQTELVALKVQVDEVHRMADALVKMHHDSDSKFSTVRLKEKFDDFEHRIANAIQRVQIAVERRH
jgi:hypothetical protein